MKTFRSVLDHYDETREARALSKAGGGHLKAKIRAWQKVRKGRCNKGCKNRSKNGNVRKRKRKMKSRLMLGNVCWTV